MTDEAAAVLSSVSVPEGSVLRLEAVEGGRMGFLLGVPLADDEIVVARGAEVLRVSAPLGERLDGALLDVQPAPAGSPPRLLLRKRSTVDGTPRLP